MTESKDKGLPTDWRYTFQHTANASIIVAAPTLLLFAAALAKSYGYHTETLLAAFAITAHAPTSFLAYVIFIHEEVPRPFWFRMWILIASPILCIELLVVGTILVLYNLSKPKDNDTA